MPPAGGRREHRTGRPASAAGEASAAARRLFGDAARAVVDCPRCSSRLEVAFRASDLIAADPDDSPLTFLLDGQPVTLRRVTTSDLRAVAASATAEALLERVIVMPAPSDLPPASHWLDEGARRLALADPQAHIEMAMQCPQCALDWTASYDVVGFLWQELDSWAVRTLRDVHIIASAYGWSEHDILEDLRFNGNVAKIRDVSLAVFERNGHICGEPWNDRGPQRDRRRMAARPCRSARAGRVKSASRRRRAAGGRPNMLVRYPDGITGEFFYQKRAPASRPSWIEVVSLRFPSGRKADEVVPRDAAALVWLANLACLELHPHPVRADDLDHPDELRVDLDPVPGIGWEQIIRVALEAREAQAARVPAGLRSRYERIRRGRAPLALYPLHGDACGHCFTAVPTQRRSLIARGASMEGCEACGVLLYAAE